MYYGMGSTIFSEVLYSLDDLYCKVYLNPPKKNEKKWGKARKKEKRSKKKRVAKSDGTISNLKGR